MHSRGSRFLSQTAYRILDFRRRRHHEVGKLVDDDNNLRLAVGVSLIHSHEFVVGVQILYVVLREEFVSLVHLFNGDRKCACRLARICDHRRQHVRNAVVVAEFNDLRVYHDEFQLGRSRLVEETRDY